MAASLWQRAAALAVVAIPAWNEAERIADCLAALGRQTLPLAGSVLLANNCTDATASLARSVNLPFRLDIRPVELPPNQANAGLARRLAIEGAANLAGPNGIVLTTDADAVVPPDWVALNLDAVTQARKVCAGRRLSTHESGTSFHRICTQTTRWNATTPICDAMTAALCPDRRTPGHVIPKPPAQAWR